MTLKRTLQRQDQPIHIGPRHGYRIEGEHVFINAELEIPPYHSGGEWTLELWATEQPYVGGELAGARVARLTLELPTPIGPYVHLVDTRTPARLPLQGRARAMVLALIEHGPDGQESVHAFANYAQPQTFIAPRLDGLVGYRLEGPDVVLEADGIDNPRPRDNLSGTLALELWAFPVPGSSTEGVRLAASELETLAGQSRLVSVERRAAFSEPPVGRFQIALLLCEWTFADGYVARDRRDFPCLYEQSAPEQPPVLKPAPIAAPARPVDRLRLIPTDEPAVPATLEERVQSEVEAPEPAAVAEPIVAMQPHPAVVAVAAVTAVTAAVAAVAPPSTAAKGSPARAVGPSKPPSEAPRAGAPGLVSIQSASVEELAKVKGLNLKVAREIVKARPFSSLADLIRVRGLGQKTIDRLKGLVTL